MLGKRFIAPVTHARVPAFFSRRSNTKRRVGRALDDENPLTFVRELFGSTGDDPGHWNFSPEWWGTQNNGWGRDSGDTVFSGESVHGNGKVTVTAHSCSCQEGPAGTVQQWRVLRFNDITRQSVAKITISHSTESLSSTGSNPAGAAATAEADSGTQFDQAFGSLAVSTTRSVLRSSAGNSQAVGLVPNGGSSPAQWTVVQQADCLAPEYLKSMASLAAALIGMLGLLPRTGLQSEAIAQLHGLAASSTQGAGFAQKHPLRILCIGLGGGSLPLFLAHHYPNALVDAVELDPMVVAAATQAMGLPTALPNLRLHTQDAREYVAQFLSAQQRWQRHGGGQSRSEEQPEQQYFDLVFLDAFDGEDDVPEELCSKEFAKDLAQTLHPQRGALVINMHALPSSPPLPLGINLGWNSPPAEAGYDPKTPNGSLIVSVGSTFASAVRDVGEGGDPGAVGGSTSRRDAAGDNLEDHFPSSSGNAALGGSPDVRAFTVSVQRQLNVQVVVARGLPLEDDRRSAVAELKAVSSFVADEAEYRFPTGKRACRGFWELR